MDDWPITDAMREESLISTEVLIGDADEFAAEIAEGWDRYMNLPPREKETAHGVH